ncbi:GtrA family protein [Limnohabitans sp. TS-CS-82]|jgi:putative flippase GtrA|uniref:GtrA family protein n=1 Tax=Limnohabitans sp. TS-CS-82 TaxID=2094193 RepID=UPI000CF29F53|nr:GtrA family protein [Limnohabitans sp. TS-CS-82]PQA83674.1 GtrA family protein [Limnohabitans sp. TS-CS-82]
MHSGFWFLVVGSAAAATHMGVFELTKAHLWPELANAAGFCVAFVVSFAGHRRLSFQDAGTSFWQSLRRFAATALAGFVANELMFVVLLRGLNLPDWLALFFALVFASAQTFLLSRFWAFRRRA